MLPAYTRGLRRTERGGRAAEKLCSWTRHVSRSSANRLATDNSFMNPRDVQAPRSLTRLNCLGILKSKPNFESPIVPILKTSNVQHDHYTTYSLHHNSLSLGEQNHRRGSWTSSRASWPLMETKDISPPFRCISQKPRLVFGFPKVVVRR